jgi:hypothetical protein
MPGDYLAQNICVYHTIPYLWHTSSQSAGDAMNYKRALCADRMCDQVYSFCTDDDNCSASLSHINQHQLFSIALMIKKAPTSNWVDFILGSLALWGILAIVVIHTHRTHTKESIFSCRAERAPSPTRVDYPKIRSTSNRKRAKVYGARVLNQFQKRFPTRFTAAA